MWFRLAILGYLPIQKIIVCQDPVPSGLNGGERGLSWNCCPFPFLWSFCFRRLQVRYPSAQACRLGVFLLLMRGAFRGQEVGAHISSLTQDLLWSMRAHKCLPYLKVSGWGEKFPFVSGEDRCRWDMALGNLTTKSLKADKFEEPKPWHVRGASAFRAHLLAAAAASVPTAAGTVCHPAWHARAMTGAGKSRGEPSL